MCAISEGRLGPIFREPPNDSVGSGWEFQEQGGIVDYCDRHGIFLDVVPGQAHWKIGGCEQAVQGLKSVMDKLCHAEETLDPEEALASAVQVFNQRDVI